MIKSNEELTRLTQGAMFVDREYREKSLKRDKLLPRERINAILD
jgi:acetyl-CoA carboxylase carboxyltransferase component